MAEEKPARSRWEQGSTGPNLLPVIAIREQWKAASCASGWRYPGDWWTPAVEVVAQSVVDSQDLALGLRQLGRERADSGVDLVETVDDVTALVDLLCYDGFPPEWIRALVEGWSEVTCLPCRTSCVDPLTKLLPLGFLRTRIEELYRAAQQRQLNPCTQWAFVFVAVRSSSDHLRLGRKELCNAPSVFGDMVILGECLQEVFADSELLGAAGRGRALAIMENHEGVADRLERLKERLTDRFLDGFDQVSEVVTEIEPFPSVLPAALELVEQFSRH